MEKLTINGGKENWVDKEQLESFIEEYNRSFDKERFLSDKQEQHSTIYLHATQCIYWEGETVSNRRFDLALRRQERCKGIFEHLKQHGYGPEIAYFGEVGIQESCASFFKTSKPLTDKEWARMWPDWLKTMDDLRSQRIDKTVYQPRRNLLVTEYNTYVTSPSPNTPSFDLLPHVIELGCFPPFRDIIKAPEGTEMGEKPFESAFAQLPVFVDEWRKQLDAKLAELVKIPSQLSSKAPCGRAVSSSSEGSMDSFEAPTNKLHLACAVFKIYGTVAWYPDVLFGMAHPLFGGEPWDREMPVQDRFKVKWLEDAPNIVRACGLDPNVATVEDMDRRNARLTCLSCNDSCIRNWKGSLYHSTSYSHIEKTSCPKSPHWQVVNNEYIEAIQPELSVFKEPPLQSSRCLLCRPRVGDAQSQDITMRHLVRCHSMQRNDIQECVHYTPIGMRHFWTSHHVCVAVTMDENDLLCTKVLRVNL
ncbi:hypothetical protein HD554DRAFT_2042983 [Boletus coccyginus]|nr:hypothetical protein HD554DRAFT_2042983 [Boletus coccyginus]